MSGTNTKPAIIWVSTPLVDASDRVLRRLNIDLLTYGRVSVI